MTNDDWVQAAMADDTLVAEVLIQLSRAKPSLLPPPPLNRGGSTVLKLDWSVRQPRSKAAPPTQKKGDQARASPTTPLSWSGATSISGGGGGGSAAVDGVEESSGAVKPPETIRSKISRPTGTTPFKRSRKKKTLTELKEEESILLEERKSLKNELASIQVLLEQQRAKNIALKKLKAESQSSRPCKVASPAATAASPAAAAASPAAAAASPRGSAKREDSDMKEGSSFLLPDLNITLDNDPSREVLCGTTC